MTGTTGFPGAGCEELTQEPLPSRHQRRILICAGEPGADAHAGGHTDVYAATARWQRQYVGGVYVRLSGTPEQQRAVVARFTAAGCTLQATHFYRPADVRALASLARQLEALPVEVLPAEGGFEPGRVAELLMVGATDVVGPYPQRYTAAARAAASFVNERLGEAWLALPMVTRAEGTSYAVGGPHTHGAPGSRAGFTQEELEDHFADTARALAAETENRLEVLGRLPMHGEAVPCPAAALCE